MKNLLTSPLQINALQKLRSSSILLAIFFLFSNCNENRPEAKPKIKQKIESVIKPSSTNKVQVAFAGGGWRAHTAHTGWTISLLNNDTKEHKKEVDSTKKKSPNRTLNDIFANVETIGSNSGGSWFSTMLMYSPKFVTDIEKPDALSNWKDTGWLGGQQRLFNAAPSLCQKLSGDAFVTCVLGYYSGTHLKWDEVVESLIYEDYPLGATLLNGTRQKWATDKSLLLAATMLTNNVVLNSKDFLYDQYYQACLSPGKPVLNDNGEDNATCDNGTTPDVTPVTFSSTPSASGLSTPPFFPEAGSSKQLHIGYSQNASHHPDTAHATIQNPIASDQVEVIHAAAASSAALGFAASKNISGHWDRSYAADNLALNFSLSDSTAKFMTAENGTSVGDLASKKMISLADGGPVDNSGVAQLVGFLQLNKKNEDFNIVAFDNVQGSPFVPGVNGAEVGSDLAMLFGRALCLDNKFCSGFSCDGVCLMVADLQIFEEAAIDSPVTWSYVNQPAKYKNTPKLIYTKYTVTTTANSSFGIKAGSTGVLHAFTCYYTDAATVPQNNIKDEDFVIYNDMIQFINTGLKANKNEGLKHLEAAVGLDR